MRVAFLTNIISPYRKPVFDRLASTSGWDLRVFINAKSEFDRSWHCNYGELDAVQMKTFTFNRTVVSWEPVQFKQRIALHFPLDLWPRLAKFKPDVIISHELGPRTILASAYARYHKIPLVIWSYQSRISATQGQGCRGIVRRKVLKLAQSVVGMGTDAREVLRGWGVNNKLIVDAPNAANHHSLLSNYKAPTTKYKAKLLKERHGNNRRIALVVGRLVPLKGISRILDLWRLLDPSVRDKWQLVFVGEGPLRPLVDQAAPLGVRAIGCVQPEQMAQWYMASDLHIFPSLGDVWGLVVNESMACNVPTLCSIHAGCCSDMINHGVNGFTFDPAQHERALVSLNHALTHPDLPGLGKAAGHTASTFTLDTMAQGFRDAVAMAIENTGSHQSNVRLQSGQQA